MISDVEFKVSWTRQSCDCRGEFLRIDTDRTVYLGLVRSKPSVFRGLHFQRGLTKTVRCLRGFVIDYIVDIRVGSKSFGQYDRFILSEDDDFALRIPPGFAHGVLSGAHTELLYSFSDIHRPEQEGSIRWDDPGLDLVADIDATLPERQRPVVLSDTDKNAPSLADYVRRPMFRMPMGAAT